MSEKSVQFDRKWEILKIELQIIESAISATGEMSGRVKHWAIVFWSALVALSIKEQSLHKYIILISLVPFAFLVVESFYRRSQKRFVFRQIRIREYLNSDIFESDIKKGNMSFHVLDPAARTYKSDPAYYDYISMFRVVKFNTVIWMYVFMVVMTVCLWLSLLFYTPSCLVC